MDADRYGPRDWQIEVRETDATVIVPATCTRLGAGEYRLDSIPEMVESLRYGDIFEGEANGDVLRVRRILRESSWQQFVFQIPTDQVRGEKVSRVLAQVEASGGVHESSCWGLVTICLPPEANYDPTFDVIGLASPVPGLGKLPRRGISPR